MENIIKKCSSKEHEKINAVSYCPECNIYICNKCEIIHLNLLQHHHSYKFNSNHKDIFTGFCNIENHLNKLEYFCKDHNELCCLGCIAKIKGKGKGQHSNCNIVFIENIKEEKKNKLKENIDILEYLSKNLEKSLGELKLILENVKKKKEEIKMNIQNIFTKIRNALNNREEELFIEVDKHFENKYCNEDIIKNGFKLITKAKTSLESGISVNNNWKDDNKLNFYSNNCIHIYEFLF